MKYDYPHLCSPITIAGKTFPHRMFSAPMGGTDITNDGCIGPKSAAFYELRAKGGAAAVSYTHLDVYKRQMSARREDGRQSASIMRAAFRRLWKKSKIICISM